MKRERVIRPLQTESEWDQYTTITLWAYGLAQISDIAYVDKVHQLFYTPNKPICHTAF